MLTHLQPMFHSYTPWKHQKTSDFLIFSGIIEVEHWLNMAKIYSPGVTSALTLPQAIKQSQVGIIRILRVLPFMPLAQKEKTKVYFLPQFGYCPFKWMNNDRFHVVATWNTRGVCRENFHLEYLSKHGQSVLGPNQTSLMGPFLKIVTG